MAPKKKPNPDEIVHLQVAPGETVVHEGRSYGDRATLQVRRRDVDRVQGKFDVLASGADVPDVADR